MKVVEIESVLAGDVAKVEDFKELDDVKGDNDVSKEKIDGGLVFVKESNQKKWNVIAMEPVLQVSRLQFRTSLPSIAIEMVRTRNSDTDTQDVAQETIATIVAQGRT
ncbi:uncharacterized protein LOC107774736 isoform X2 [Nicotiana tabacum]|uniref:Uncharacterized protein LOC107774736 isoform X2 n=1 Tax=Nicotiana tabacum TaxID=4097 RepID=A0AC58UB00_TOBAC